MSFICINCKEKSIKNIRSEIKYGATAADFAKFFETTEDEFLTQLSKKVGQRYKDYKRELDSNKSKKKKNERHHAFAPNQNSADSETTIQLSKACETDVKHDSYKEEDFISTYELNPCIEPYSSEIFENSREKELKQNVESISSEVKMLSTECDRLEGVISEIDKDSARIKNKVFEIAKVLKGYESELEDLKLSRENAEAKKTNFATLLESKKEELDRAIAELEECRKVIVSCKKDGIEISVKGFEPTPNDIEAKYMELSKLGNVDDYAVKHVRAAAEVLCVVEMLEVMEMNYAVEYEECFAPVEKIVTSLSDAA